MANPTELDGDLPLDEVRAVLTRGRGRITADMCRRLPNLASRRSVRRRARQHRHRRRQDSGCRRGARSGRTTHAVSEHALLLMLALARRVTSSTAPSSGVRGVSARDTRVSSFAANDSAVIGLGAIGRRIAELGTVLGMNVAYWSRTSRDPGCPLLELDELVSTADVIQICVALTPETHGLIGSDQFARMKPGVLLVNTARAQIVDHQALLAAINGGVVGGYGTDVWDPEPPATDDPLVADERVVITPHVAGLTDVTYREICVGPAAAAVALLAGVRPDPTCVFR